MRGYNGNRINCNILTSRLYIKILFLRIISILWHQILQESSKMKQEDLAPYNALIWQCERMDVFISETIDGEENPLFYILKEAKNKHIELQLKAEKEKN